MSDETSESEFARALDAFEAVLDRLDPARALARRVRELTAELADRDRTIAELREALLEWWKWHRPDAFTESDHIENPTVNRGEHDAELCRLAARAALEKAKETNNE